VQAHREASDLTSITARLSPNFSINGPPSAEELKALRTPETDPGDARTWRTLAQALLGSNEFLYVD
jgi:hypothetical protein